MTEESRLNNNITIARGARQLVNGMRERNMPCRANLEQRTWHYGRRELGLTGNENQRQIYVEGW